MDKKKRSLENKGFFLIFLSVFLGVVGIAGLIGSVSSFSKEVFTGSTITVFVISALFIAGCFGLLYEALKE